MPIKIFIPSYQRATKISTPSLLGGVDFKVVLHNNEERESYIKAHPELEPHIIVSGLPPGISAQRQWIKDNLVKDNEWFAMLDDNIRKFNIFPDEIYDNEELVYDASKRFYWEHCYGNAQRLMQCFEETITEAEWRETGFCGFANIDNAFFRRKKWKSIGLIVAKMCLQKKDDLRYDPLIHCIDDYDYSIAAMLKYGSILVNSYVCPIANHNEAGGLGKLEERAPRKREDCKRLMEKYPGLLRYKDRKNSLEGCEVSLRFYSEKSFMKWRESYGQLRQDSVQAPEHSA